LHPPKTRLRRPPGLVIVLLSDLLNAAIPIEIAEPSHQIFPFLLDSLTLFGLLAVTAMLVFYALEDRSPWFILAFAGACGLASAYGFLQGAWPFGVAEAIWAIVAAHRWWRKSS